MARTPPVAPVEAPGNFITGALYNASVGALINWSTGSGSNGPPRFQAYSSTSQSLTSGAAYTSLTLDTELVDTDAGHSTVTNTSRYVVQVAGFYLIVASCGFPNNATGNRSVRIGINGVASQSGQVATAAAAAGNSWYGCVTTFAQLNINDYVECQAWQTSGGNLATNGGAQIGPSLALLWVSG